VSREQAAPLACTVRHAKARPDSLASPVSLIAWIAVHAAEGLLCLWVLRWGGAEWLEGTFTSGVLFGSFAPRWSAEGLKMAALILLVFCAVSFVAGLFVPGLRCWAGGGC